MDWKLAIEEERTALMRMVSLLFALAGLAECAASRSPAMRGFVLWILRHAEAAARDFVAGGQEARTAPMPAGPDGRPADAMRLAESLRALARQLAGQLEGQAKLMRGECGAGTEPRQSGGMPAMHDVALSMPAAFACQTPHPAPDTS